MRFPILILPPLMSNKPTTPGPDSDSDDEDYVPQAEARLSEPSDEEHGAKRVRTETPPAPEQDAAEKKRARDALWASFQAPLAETSVKPTPKVEMVKVEKRFRYAGEIVTEVVEVPADSTDAKKWPLWQASEESSTLKSDALGEPTDSARLLEPSSSMKPGKRPGPRKSKITLAAIPTASSQKAKKISTLEKSAMDWQAHIQSSQEHSLKDELEAHRRAGGYLEKVEFLNRVDERRDDIFDANKSHKRRRPH